MLRGLGNKMRFWKRREDEEQHNNTVEEPPPSAATKTKKQQEPIVNKNSESVQKQTTPAQKSLLNDNDKVIFKKDHDEIEIGTDDEADAKSNVKHVQEQPNKEVPPPDTKSPHKKKQKMQTCIMTDADKVLVEGQHDRELKAEQEGLYVKNQRVKYHHRATDTYYENAVICGVHLDDGPDKPYYTIKYMKKLDDGTEETMEKQTTPDRLERVPWDEKATWAIMKKKKK